ncbi:BMC domain-containing protein [Sodalis sp. RH21]|uniref:BMC domain-containing protein n=1 Tax=unclassified Sodalis (in: enterobacteria) TaxID=2636512 RepID=UPI0039B6D67A
MQHSLGLIEVSGLALAITVADVMAKAASIGLVGVERTEGLGWLLVKINGDVAAVGAALAAGEETARRSRGFIASTIIARPADGTRALAMAYRRRAAAVRPPAATPEIAEPAAPVPAISPEIAEPVAPVPAISPEIAEPVVSRPEAGREFAGPAAPPPATSPRAAEPASSLPAIFQQAAESPFAGVETTMAEDTLPLAGTARTLGTVAAEPAVAVADRPAAAKPTCNLCGDPSCARSKGEPRNRCIHHQKELLR